MNAIKKVRKHLAANPHSESSRVLGKLVIALGEETPFNLAELYELDYETFALALELLKDWRLDRYYASRLALFDVTHLQLSGESDMPPDQGLPLPAAPNG